MRGPNVRLAEERRRRGWTQEDLVTAVFQTSASLGMPEPGIDAAMVSTWERGRHHPSREHQVLLCATFGVPPAVIGFAPTPRLLAGLATVQSGQPDGVVHSSRAPGAFSSAKLSASDDSRSLSDEAIDLAAWIEQSNVGASTIALLAEATRRLAEDHTRRPPRRMLADVLCAHRQVQKLIREGKQRLGQARNLLTIEADLLAHACILLGDLHEDEAAIAYGATAALCAEEAGSSRAAALSAQAKTERWRRRYAVSAELARRGFECSPPTPLRVLLASQEANASALAGDHQRARRALRKAEEVADDSLAPDSGVSPWSCPRPRQALYSLSVAIQTNDPASALLAAHIADAGWASGEPWVYGTWAQVRFGAGIAHVMLGDLDGAIEQVSPVMGMPPEFRVATVTSYLIDLDARLDEHRFRGSTAAGAIREQIREFNSIALPAGSPAPE